MTSSNILSSSKMKYRKHIAVITLLVARVWSIFTKVSNNKMLEADLLVYTLEVPFSLSTNLFCTCFTQYNTKVAQIVKRLITLVTKKLHEDYRIEYTGKINSYLQVLHRTSSHVDAIYNLPSAI